MEQLVESYVWVIGASSGIGAAVAKELAKSGANVALSARRENELNKICAQLVGDKHLVVPLDVADKQSIEYGLERLTQKWPRIDRVIFFAAVYSSHTEKRKPLDFIHKMIQVNLMGACTVVEKVLPIMQKQKQGQIVLCGSVAGYRGVPYGQPYCLTKAGIINYAESLKSELAADNIDVKLINPGFVKTPLTDKNTFTMPMIISSEEAAKSICKGLVSRSFEIHFPKKFTYIMKVIKMLPDFIYFKLTKRMIKNEPVNYFV